MYATKMIEKARLSGKSRHMTLRKITWRKFAKLDDTLYSINYGI